MNRPPLSLCLEASHGLPTTSSWPGTDSLPAPSPSSWPEPYPPPPLLPFPPSPSQSDPPPRFPLLSVLPLRPPPLAHAGRPIRLKHHPAPTKLANSLSLSLPVRKARRGSCCPPPIAVRPAVIAVASAVLWPGGRRLCRLRHFGHFQLSSLSPPLQDLSVL